MHIVKLNAIGSTNTYLREFCRNLNVIEDILVSAREQTAGKGQMGTFWESEAGKNLTFSVFKKVRILPVGQQFFITMATSLAIYEMLHSLGVEKVSVKWPNDILAGKEKICGVLIDSVIKNGRLDAVIIGVGLNVNQTNFTRAPRATSIKLQKNEETDLDNLLDELIKQFYKYVDLLTEGEFDVLKSSYEEKLFRKGIPSSFRNADDSVFNGIIQGVTNTGNLIVLLEDDSLAEYGTKQIELLY
ncbi:MAG: biotin--[acetyl-CoA-carboxylase] ligase [Leeuwenhoekiella sp.]